MSKSLYELIPLNTIIVVHILMRFTQIDVFSLYTNIDDTSNGGTRGWQGGATATQSLK